ncbi:hypothetical protein FGO68_gene11982 [Halteria grandinella]|uniref:Uncharacterized protein n=1 Tax=Halteria grandinella TaxID=5974 RepID=A0A8J8NWX2_HALGN|nr:hypothetical protein FGO68_gene11982 [Halteria grandinella]
MLPWSNIQWLLIDSRGYLIIRITQRLALSFSKPFLRRESSSSNPTCSFSKVLSTPSDYRVTKSLSRLPKSRSPISWLRHSPDSRASLSTHLPPCQLQLLPSYLLISYTILSLLSGSR